MDGGSAGAAGSGSSKNLESLHIGKHYGSPQILAYNDNSPAWKLSVESYDAWDIDRKRSCR